MTNIELAPEKYRIHDVSYDEAVLYCFQLVIDGEAGWRLPTMHEYLHTEIWKPRRQACWFWELNSFGKKFDCIPVRDKK